LKVLEIVWGYYKRHEFLWIQILNRVVKIASEEMRVLVDEK
jgi:hypothetical protein